MKFKDRLKELRKEFELTQEEFAQKIGYTRTAVSAWEIGRNEPSNDDTIKLANFFDVTIDYLLGKSDVKNIETQTNKPPYYKEMEGLSDDEIASALKFYKEMKSKINIYFN